MTDLCGRAETETKFIVPELFMVRQYATRPLTSTSEPYTATKPSSGCSILVSDGCVLRSFLPAQYLALSYAASCEFLRALLSCRIAWFVSWPESCGSVWLLAVWQELAQHCRVGLILGESSHFWSHICFLRVFSPGFFFQWKQIPDVRICCSKNFRKL